jgi:hypothetical protein
MEGIHSPFETAMKSKFAAAMFALFAINAAQAAIITNGDFESGATGWTFTGNAGLATQYGGGFYWGGGSVAQNGRYAVAFNGGDTAPNGTVSQRLATTAGASYTVSFNYGASSASVQSLNWSIFGIDANVALVSGLVSDTNPAGLLNSYTFAFVANSAATTLRFSDFSGNNTYSNDGLLDNINVIANPAAVSVPASPQVRLNFSRWSSCRRCCDGFFSSKKTGGNGVFAKLARKTHAGRSGVNGSQDPHADRDRNTAIAAAPVDA